MLCCVVLCCVMLCCVMLCCVVLCYVMLCYVMLCYVMLCLLLFVVKRLFPRFLCFFFVRWLNDTGLVTAFAFDGVAGVTEITEGAVTQAAASVSLKTESGGCRCHVQVFA